MSFDARGNPDAPRPEVTLGTLGAFVRSAREMMTGQGICVGACASCSGPLMIPTATALRLPCDRCAGGREVPASAAVASPIDGLSCGLHATAPGKGSFDLTYTLERAEATSLGGHACPQCGAPVPPGQTADACAYCHTPLWMVDSQGRRYTYVLHMRGRRRRKRIDERVPLSQAEAAIAPDVAVWRGAAGIIKGIGLFVGIGVAVLVVIPLLCLGAFLVLTALSGGGS